MAGPRVACHGLFWLIATCGTLGVTVAAGCSLTNDGGEANAVREKTTSRGGQTTVAPGGSPRARDGLILFWRESPWPSIWSVRPDGSNLRWAYRTKQNAKRPTLSPGGRWIAFDGASPGKPPLVDFDIQIVRVNGKDRRTLVGSPQWELDAQWSPDGERLSYSRWRPSGQGDDWLRSEIWTVRADGGGELRLGRGIGARWSPSGKYLAFGAPTAESDGDLFVIRADGTGRRRLLATPELEQPAGWSPDGTKILFTRFNLPEGSDAFVMSADGTDVRRVTHARGDDIAAAWSPDGSRILFTSGPPGSSQIFVMDLDGSNRRDISGGEFTGSEPSWHE
jgi:Tol biopolymer transport system component